MAAPASFRRIEKKYRLGPAAHVALEQALAERLAHDKSRDGLVTSLYLDTPERLLISRSMDKPPYKEKLRLRAYGAEAGEALVRAFEPAGARLSAKEGAQPVFLEMKRKVDGITYKRRLGLALGAARLALDGAPLAQAAAACPLPGARPATWRERQIARELAAFLKRYGELRPLLAIRCERQAWGLEAVEEAGLRVTFDAALAFASMESPRLAHGRPHGSHPCEPAGVRHGTPLAHPCELLAVRPGAPFAHPCKPPGASAARWRALIAPEESVMEVKCAGAYPLWLVEALSCAGAYPQSFSKCGAAAALAFAPATKGTTHA